MKTGQLKITSKNQITIPIEVVKKLKINKGNFLKWQFKDDKLILTSEQDVLKAMQPFWSKHKAKRGLTEDELNDAMRDIAHKIEA